MYHIIFAVLFLSACTSVSQTNSQQDAKKVPTRTSIRQNTEKITAFVGVDVLPMDQEKVLKEQTVLIKGDRIVALGPSSTVTPPNGAETIEGKGFYLLPGFGEMHGHIPGPETSQETIEAILFLYLANGITTVRGMLGTEGQLKLREKARKSELLAPTLYLAGPSFHGRSINSPEEAIQKVKKQKQEGWNLLKIHPGLTKEEYDAMAKTAREEEIRFAGHVPQEVGILHALEQGQETIDHLDGYVEYLETDKGPLSKEKLSQLVQKTKESNAWVVPTMALWDTLLGVANLEDLQNYSELIYMPTALVERWNSIYQQRQNSTQFNEQKSHQVAQDRIEVLRALYQGGVKILFGTDAPQQFSVPGFSLHRELPYMQKAGMSAYDILCSGTKNVGEYFQKEDTFGTIAIGSRADLILLEANPMDDISNLSKISGVMVRGKWMDKEQIQEKLSQIKALYQ